MSGVTGRFICTNKGGGGSAGRRQTEVEIHAASIVRPGELHQGPVAS